MTRGPSDQTLELTRWSRPGFRKISWTSAPTSTWLLSHVGQNTFMDVFGMFGFMFGMIGLSVAATALNKANKLETELKRRGVLDEKFGREK